MAVVGDRLVSAADDRSIKLWDLRGLQQIGPRFERQSDTVTAIAIMAAGLVVAIWRGATPRIEQLPGGAPIAGAVVRVQTRRKAVLAFTDKPR